MSLFKKTFQKTFRPSMYQMVLPIAFDALHYVWLIFQGSGMPLEDNRWR